MDSCTQKDVRGVIEHILKICEVAAVHCTSAGMLPTAVFDLDATLITETDRGIELTLDFVQRLQDIGVKCYLVTARTSDNYDYTLNLVKELSKTHPCLRKMELFCLPLESVGSSNIIKMHSKQQYEMISTFKYIMRWAIHMGIGPLIVAMGDQLWDVRYLYKYDTKRDNSDKCFVEFDKNEPQLVSMKLPRAVMKHWRNH
jgi:hypothetical protein